MLRLLDIFVNIYVILRVNAHSANKSLKKKLCQSDIFTVKIVLVMDGLHVLGRFATVIYLKEYFNLCIQ